MIFPLNKKDIAVKTVFKLFVPLLITGITFYLISKYLSLSILLSNLRAVPIWVFLACFFLFLMSYFFRTLQINMLLPKKLLFPRLYAITIIHNTTLQIIPFRLGEISFVYLLHKSKETTIPDASITLFVARIFDIFAITLILSLSLFFVGDVPYFPNKNPTIIASSLILLVFSSLLFIVKRSKVQINTSSYFKVKQRNIFMNAFYKIRHLFSHFASIPSKLILTNIIPSTLGVWICYYSAIYLLYFYAGLTIPLSHFLLVASGAMFSAFIPIQGIAGFGNVEASWSILLMLMGIDSILALKTTVITHVIGVTTMLFIGGIASGYYLIILKKNNLL